MLQRQMLGRTGFPPSPRSLAQALLGQFALMVWFLHLEAVLVCPGQWPDLHRLPGPLSMTYRGMGGRVGGVSPQEGEVGAGSWVRSLQFAGTSPFLHHSTLLLAPHSGWQRRGVGDGEHPAQNF